MKRFKILFALALVLVLACAFMACELDTAIRTTVEFDDPRYGIQLPPIYVARGTGMGDQMPIPQSPEPGVVLGGWFDGATQYYRDTIVTGETLKLTARWSDDIVTVRFVFAQKDNSGKVIMPVAKVPDEIKGIRGIPLSPLSYPVTPRSKGWQFDDWRQNSLDGELFNSETPVPGEVTLYAHWVAKKVYKVSFNPGPGVTPIPAIDVFENECIDEWMPPGKTQFPPNPTVNPVNTSAFFVSWLDDENRAYDGRTPITRALTIIGKWGLPPFIVDFDRHIKEIVGSTDSAYGNVDYAPKVVDSWDNPSQRVIVNTVTYDVPYNTNRWRILYRIEFDWPDGFDTGFYTKYTIRGRFYANQQGAQGWKDPTNPNDPHGGDFVPDVPAKEAGYKMLGWLKKKGYDEFDAEGNRVEISRSNDGWGQISWCLAPNWNGGGNDAETLLQRYNIDRKGGTIGDDWVPARGSDAEKGKPAYLLVQTSDNYVGHVEITQIVFYNGIVSDDPLLDEWKHGAYIGEKKPESGQQE